MGSARSAPPTACVSSFGDTGCPEGPSRGTRCKPSTLPFCESKPMVQFWGRCTTHFRTSVSHWIGMFTGCAIWILTHGHVVFSFGSKGRGVPHPMSLPLAAPGGCHAGCPVRACNIPRPAYGVFNAEQQPTGYGGRFFVEDALLGFFGRGKGDNNTLGYPCRDTPSWHLGSSGEGAAVAAKAGFSRLEHACTCRNCQCTAELQVCLKEKNR